MKIYKNANDTMRVGAEKRDGKYIIIIQKEHKMIAGTRSGKTAVESYYTKYEKAFDTAEQANRYFMGIKRNNPTLKAM